VKEILSDPCLLGDNQTSFGPKISHAAVLRSANFARQHPSYTFARVYGSTCIWRVVLHGRLARVTIRGELSRLAAVSCLDRGV
jgi:hypothetical protein